MYALCIKNLSKIYNEKTIALKSVNLQVKKGDFFALLGPNGAGKSTLISIISSLILKTTGEIKIFGYNIKNQLKMAKSCIGVVPQEFNFNIFEKPVDILVTHAGFYGVPKKIALIKAEEYLKKLDLWKKRNVISMHLSGGMKRRLMIARALMHNPKLLILDEPTAGVDIQIRHATWDFLKEMNKKGTTIILTTHYLDEAEHLCKKIAIINKGKIIENTTLEKLMTKINIETFLIYTENEPNIKKITIPGFYLKQLDNRIIEVESNKKQPLSNLFDKLSEHNIKIKSIQNKSNKLEELFLHLVKKENKNG